MMIDKVGVVFQDDAKRSFGIQFILTWWFEVLQHPQHRGPSVSHSYEEDMIHPYTGHMCEGGGRFRGGWSH